ncbi:hypothetical protein Dimus_013508 [Dionaea muscipula]
MSERIVTTRTRRRREDRLLHDTTVSGQMSLADTMTSGRIVYRHYAEHDGVGADRLSPLAEFDGCGADGCGSWATDGSSLGRRTYRERKYILGSKAKRRRVDVGLESSHGSLMDEVRILVSRVARLDHHLGSGLPHELRGIARPLHGRHIMGLFEENCDAVVDCGHGVVHKKSAGVSW